MKRKKRNPVNLKANTLRYQISKWCKTHKDEAFNVPILTEELGLNPDSFSDRNNVYRCILYWREKFKDFYEKQKRIGTIDNMNRYEAWDTMLYNYNQNDAYVFLSKYDKELRCHYFVQPGFDMLENMDKRRLNKQWKGIKTVIEEMQLQDARLILSDGSRQPITELLEAGKNVTELLGEGDPPASHGTFKKE